MSGQIMFASLSAAAYLVKIHVELIAVDLLELIEVDLLELIEVDILELIDVYVLELMELSALV